jgi:glycosyltransferase XagB
MPSHPDEPSAVGMMPRPLNSTSAVPGARKRPAAVRRGHRSRLTPLPDELSAKTTVTRRQVIVIRWVCASVLILLPVAPIPTLITLIAVATALYLGAFVFRVRIFWRALRDPSEIRITDKRADDLWDHALPAYTVLVPAFREPEVIAQVISSLGQLDYPAERLDIKLLLEEDDTETIAAAEAARPPEHIQIVLVPAGEPRTKPRACNYGLAMARGKFVTIYDAEDHPEPLQLRRAVAAFRGVDERVACLQAKLSYHNPGQNSITRWFTTEYAMWFSQLLPGLIEDSAPLPLGGTSNHFRREVLDEIGGWDAYNVTEDADLGIRLHRAGYRTAVLDSTTFEEANSDFVNWVKQRSRWYKGYMQTWLVHMRHPVQLYRELGLGGFIGFNLFVGGTPFLALMNPFFWALTAVWILGRIELIDDLFPFWLYYVGVGCFAFGNLLFIYTNMIAARQHGRPELVLAAVLSPIYWVMMSIAAVKALVQLITAPTFWEKTQHGLDKKQPAEATRAGA